MKRIISLGLVLMLVSTTLIGCQIEPPPGDPEDPAAIETESTQT